MRIVQLRRPDLRAQSDRLSFRPQKSISTRAQARAHASELHICAHATKALDERQEYAISG